MPGLYFLGLPWLSKMNSSFLAGVGDDTARLAQHMTTPGSAGHPACSEFFEGPMSECGTFRPSGSLELMSAARG